MSNFNEMSHDAQKKADEVYREGKHKVESLAHQFTKNASHIYDESKKKVNDLEVCLEDYSEVVLKKVKENPLTSLVVAGGVGFLLSYLLKK